MPGAGRLGDSAYIPADSHGCPACPHSARGPATTGSADVMINGRPALRVGDQGVHSSCCGPNTWQAATGASSVLINGRPAHRLGDGVQHCGGSGALAEGSTDVIIGDEVFSGLPPAGDTPPFSISFIVCYEGSKVPAPNRRYRIVREGGQVIDGTTDEEGRTVTVHSAHAEQVRLEVLEDDGAEPCGDGVAPGV